MNVIIRHKALTSEYNCVKWGRCGQTDLIGVYAHGGADEEAHLASFFLISRESRRHFSPEDQGTHR